MVSGLALSSSDSTLEPQSWGLEVWQVIVDRLPNGTQERWAERLAALPPLPADDSVPTQIREPNPNADDSEPLPTSAPTDPED